MILEFQRGRNLAPGRGAGSELVRRRRARFGAARMARAAAAAAGDFFELFGGQFFFVHTLIRLRIYGCDLVMRRLSRLILTRQRRFVKHRGRQHLPERKRLNFNEFRLSFLIIVIPESWNERPNQTHIRLRMR